MYHGFKGISHKLNPILFPVLQGISIFPREISKFPRGAELRRREEVRSLIARISMLIKLYSDYGACNLISKLTSQLLPRTKRMTSKQLHPPPPPGCTFLYFIFGGSKLGRVARILDCAGLLTVVSLSLYLLDYVGLIAWSSP